MISTLRQHVSFFHWIYLFQMKDCFLVLDFLEDCSLKRITILGHLLYLNCEVLLSMENNNLSGFDVKKLHSIMNNPILIWTYTWCLKYRIRKLKINGEENREIVFFFKGYFDIQNIWGQSWNISLTSKELRNLCILCSSYIVRNLFHSKEESCLK